jgi:hypothetical protein
MRQDESEIWMILDRSGSMGSIHAGTVEAFNTYLARQQAEPGTARFTLRQFDHEVIVTHDLVPLPELTPMALADFEPRGSTALYDALGQAIDDLGHCLAAMPEAERPGNVVMAILTDGEENASTRYTRKQVAERIQHQREVYDWTILFLGADFDVDKVADELQIAKDSRACFDKSAQGVAEGMVLMSEIGRASCRERV